MLEAIISIISLDFTSIILSPLVLALSVMLLSSEKHQKEKLAGFFLSYFLAGLLVSIAGFTLGQTASLRNPAAVSSPIIDLIIGIIFTIIAVKAIILKDKPAKIEEKPHHHLFFRWLIIGLIISVTNLDALFVIFTAAKQVGDTEQFSLTFKYLFLCLNLFIFTLPVTFPVILKLLFPKIAEKILDKVNHFLIKYSRYITAVTFIIFGLYFLSRGLQSFI